MHHTPGSDPQPLFRDELDLVSRIIREVSRRARLSPDDALDFGQSVQLRLIEQQYKPIRQFSGRSSLRTYLTVVIRRMLLDWRRTQSGKWRSSAAARRLGPTAVALERLIYQGGHTLAEAIQILQARPGAPEKAEFERVAHQIPVRWTFRTVSIEDVHFTGATSFEDPVERAEEYEASVALRQRLSAALEALPATDRALLDLRYRQMLRVPAIAAALNADDKTLYRRCEKALRTLRSALQAHDDPACS